MKIFKILASVGAINWGLVAFNWNLVEALFGFSPMLVNIIYIVVAISGIVVLVKVFTGSCCGTCGVKEAAPMPSASSTEDYSGGQQ